MYLSRKDQNIKIKVLFIKHDMCSGVNFGGASQSLLDLIKSVEGEVEPYVLFAEKGMAYDVFVQNGIKCYIHPFISVMKNSTHGRRHLLLHPWRTRFGKWIRFDLPCVFFVRKLIKEEGIDLVHTNMFDSALGWTLHHFLGIKHIWHIREYADRDHVWGKIAGGRKSLVEKMNSADARIVSSKTCLDFWGFKKDNTWAILDAVRSVKDCCYEKNKQPYVLFCSCWLTGGKGAFKAVRSFGMSGLSKEGVHLRFVGNITKVMHRALLSLAEKYDCADSLEFLPFQANVKPLFMYAKVFLQPSVNEGMGRTVSEAMFYGCPVVAHASGGTLDLVEDGKTGWLFKTEEECAVLLKKVCSVNQEQIILNAQAFAKKNLSIENYGPKVLGVYHSVLDGCQCTSRG